MKQIIFRLSREWLFWFLFFFSFLLILFWAISYYRDSSATDITWTHRIEPYGTPQELLEQKEEIIQARKDVLKYDLYAEEKEELLVMYSESIEILEYLYENEIVYNDVREAGSLYYRERDRLGFGTSMVSVLFYCTILVSVIAAGQIVNRAKNNGAFVFTYLLQGRRRAFAQELGAYLVIIMSYFISQLIFVCALRREFPEGKSIILYYNAGDIKCISDSTYFMWSVLSLLMLLGGYVIFHFILAQLIENIIAYSICAFLLSLGVPWILDQYCSGKAYVAMRILMCNIYENNISVPFYLVVLLAKYLLLFLTAWAGYCYCRKRALRVQYE